MARSALVPAWIPNAGIELRDYQHKAISDIEARAREGHRKILVSGNPGVGKTALMGAIARRAYNKGQKTTILVPFNCVVTRSAAQLTQMCGALEGMGLTGKWGAFSGAFPSLERPNAPIQIVTLQTLSSQKDRLHKWLEDSDLILIDEGHSATFFKEVEKIYQAWKWKVILNFTATPFNRSQGIDERHGKLERNTAIVTLPAYRELQRRGYLSPLTYHSLLCRVGDGQKLDLSSDSAISWMLDQWLENCPDPRFTVGFCKARVSGRSQMERVQEIAATKGIRFEIVGDGISQQEYEQRMKEYEQGQCNLLCVQALSTGWDMPITQNVLLFRKIPSRDRYVQIVGRASRVAPGKSIGHVWDFAGNVDLGDKGLHPKIEDLSESIDESVLKVKERSDGEAITKTCVNSDCRKLIHASALFCPSCYTEQPIKNIVWIDPSSGKLLSSMSDLMALASKDNAIIYFRQWRKIAHANRWKPFAAVLKCKEIGLEIDMHDRRFWLGSIFDSPKDRTLRQRYEKYIKSRSNEWGWTQEKISREIDREFDTASLEHKEGG